ncbi:hypothetical protein K431DRAFT_281883 [Polychaeton citri CBS 116435]|uniref:Uncharacterized protein n=1 Tax=Polychaeton citri CBS 116435 TaxID=1314669 RepID=A0A9P4UQE7_9PEZI|nr:hypothetical protein K431DRAFT_281883 [Polychaeton citri CBS 116435]
MCIDQFEDENIRFVQGDHQKVRPVGDLSDTKMSIVESRSNVNTQAKMWRYPKYLACWTALASFQMSGETRPLGDHGMLWRTGRNLAIYNDKREWVGCIMMDEEWAAANIGDFVAFEFMLMSRSQDFNYRGWPPPRIAFYDEDIFTREPWCLLNIMLIERRGDIGARLGVGFIHEDAWAAANPTASLVYLT